MDYLDNPFGVLLALGVIALAVVAIFYSRQKRKSAIGVNTSIVETESEVIDKAARLPDLNADSLMAYLSPLRNDQPVFIHAITSLLERYKTRINATVLKSVLEQLEVSNEVLVKVIEYEELVQEAKGKPQEFERRDDITKLTHKRDTLRLQSEIDLLENPPPQPKEPPPPPPSKSREEREAEKQKSREVQETRRDKIKRGWRKDLLEDPDFNNEDIVAEIERRCRARGWLDSI